MKTTGFPLTIVVIAFDRTHTLTRLFRSLRLARYPEGQGTPLVISIDHSDTEEVGRLAEEFVWPFGPKQIIRHKTWLGLREHVLRCGDLASTHGAIVVLEDDVTVAPGFYAYARQALEFYGADDCIAGVSLYNYQLHPHAYARKRHCDLRFDPLHDGFDNWFGRFASSWGQAWTAAQWGGFRQWLKHRPAGAPPSLKLPLDVRQWPESSWKKYLHEYQVETARYFVFPRVGLSTNWGDQGTHFHKNSARFQSPLLCGEMNWRFSRLAESHSIYDAHLEIEPRCLQALAPALREVCFDVDLIALKEPAAVSAPFVLTVRAAAPAVKSFGLELHPPELNVIHDVPGNALRLVAREHWLAALNRPVSPSGRLNLVARHRPGQMDDSRLWRWKPFAKIRRWFGSPV